MNKFTTGYEQKISFSWEDAFSKFGFDDGDRCETYLVVDALIELGAEVSTFQWGLHNEVVSSIRFGDTELMPSEEDGFNLGYDEPRAFLPGSLIAALDGHFCK